VTGSISPANIYSRYGSSGCQAMGKVQGCGCGIGCNALTLILLTLTPYPITTFLFPYAEILIKCLVNVKIVHQLLCWQNASY